MSLQKNQVDNASMYLVGLIGAVLVIGGVLQIRSYIFAHERNVARPLQEQIAQLIATDASGGDEAFGGTDAGLTATQLQQQDTDQDGVNDFDEQFVHATSPYLADSDSDGISDGDEVANGSNPNCPEGEECAVIASDTASTTGTAAEVAFADLAPDSVQQAGLGQSSALEDASPEELRELLAQSGVDPEILEQTDDETLLQLAQEAAQDVLPVQGSTPADALSAEAESILALPMEQKRQLIREAGLSAEDVAALSDEEVDGLVADAVNQAVAEVTNPGVTTDSDQTE